jgi:hypothetical protein
MSNKSIFGKLSFIGGGKMAEAFICALQASGLQTMGEYQLPHYASTLGVIVNSDHCALLQYAQIKFW